MVEYTRHALHIATRIGFKEELDMTDKVCAADSIVSQNIIRNITLQF